MNFSKEDRESVTSLVVLVISIVFFIATMQIPIKNNENFMQSAKIFPLIISCIMLALSLIYVISSFRKSGKLGLEKIKNGTISFLKSSEVRRTALSVLLVGIFIFLGVAKGRFYISCAIFMAFILLMYVRRVKPWISILAVIVFITALYFIFHKLFMVQLI